MTPKKSGLADSPFFRQPSIAIPPTETPAAAIVSVFSSVQANERSDEPLHNRTTEQVNSRSSEQLNERPNERTVKRTNERFERAIFRKSYDIFEDQAEAIDDLAYRWTKERKKHITKGQVLRELLNEILPKKLK